jgi:large subunit ribosomal protein L11
MEPGTPIPVKITAFSDRSFTFIMKTPPASFFLKRMAKLDGGSKTPGRTVAGSVTMDQVREIAKIKMADLNTDNADQAAKTIAGSARSMGIKVVD